MQAQINDLSDKFVEITSKLTESCAFNETIDKYMRQFQETVNGLEEKVADVRQFDDTSFNERCVKVFTLFDEQKAQNLETINRINESEKQLASQRA